MIESDGLHTALLRLLISDEHTTDRGALERVRSALSDVTTLKDPLRAVGREASQAGQSLSVVLDRWERVVEAMATERRVVARGAVYLSHGFAELRQRDDGVSLREATDSLASRKAELSALHRVNAAANSSLDEEAILRTVVQVVAEVTGAAVCSIYLLQPPNLLVLAATRGLNPNAIGVARMALGEGITGLAAREHHAVAVSNLWRDPRANYLPETAEEPFHAIVSVPIINRSLDRLLGVLNVQDEDPREFESDEVAFLEMVCGDLALSIENARSYAMTDRQLHRKVEELTALRGLIAMVASSLEVHRVLDNIAEGAVALVEADASAIVVVDNPTPGHTRVAASFGIDAACTRDGHVGDGPVGQALHTGQPVRVPEIAARRLEAGGDDVSLNPDFHSMFAVPFQGRHHTRGALCLYARTYRDWPREEVDLVVAFANEAAMALENASLYEEAQRGLATKSVLLSELHHRVKNNLQMVASLLGLGLRHATVPEARLVLEESRARIHSIAAVHDLLSQDDVGLTTVGEVARKVAEIADLQGATAMRKIHVTVEGERIALATQQATTLAITLNELLTNTLRHAFKGRSSGHVAITYHQDDGIAELTVTDDGSGLREGFDLSEHKGLGLSIVEALTGQDLRGTLRLSPNPGGGTQAVLRFPLSPGQA